jgi:hypothetical protein
MNCTKEEWRRLDPSITQNLKFKDFLQIQSFGTVEAYPMKSGRGHYKGCLVVQIPEEYSAELDVPEVKELMHLYASLTCAVLK